MNKKCSFCNGKGYVWLGIFGIIPYRASCSTCDGTGKLHVYTIVNPDMYFIPDRIEIGK